MIAVVDLYVTQIVEPGKQGLFFLFLGFILTFLFIRFSVRMIRAGVSWWPGNISSGDVHVHHVVFGMVAMFVAGLLAFAPAGWESPWWEILGALFGIGAALVLDEFALILHLEDVYWSEQGRKSVDAVVLAAAVIGLLALGALPFGLDSVDTADTVGRWAFIVTIVVERPAGRPRAAQGTGLARRARSPGPPAGADRDAPAGEADLAVGALALPAGFPQERQSDGPRAPSRGALGAAQAPGLRCRGRPAECAAPDRVPRARSSAARPRPARQVSQTRRRGER